jgi:hypothetical protein
MWVIIVEAYSKTIDVVFRILDWMKGRPKTKLQDKRSELEIASRAAQVKGDIHELVAIRAEIEDIDKRLKSGDY